MSVESGDHAESVIAAGQVSDYYANARFLPWKDK